MEPKKKVKTGGRFLGFCSDQTWKVSLLGGFAGIFLLTHFSVYSMSELKFTQLEMNEELDQLRKTVSDSQALIRELAQQVEDYQTKMLLFKAKEEHLLEIVDPWERCMRFNYNPACTSDSTLPCVPEILGDLALALTSALDSANLTYWISYGTLLGAQEITKLSLGQQMLTSLYMKRIGKRWAIAYEEEERFNEKDINSFMTRRIQALEGFVSQMPTRSLEST